MVKGRDIDSPQFPGQGGEHFLARGDRAGEGAHRLDKFRQKRFCFTDQEKIHEIGKRLWVEENRNSSGSHERVMVGALAGMRWDACEVQHRHRIGVVIFEGNRKGEKMKFPKGPLRFY